MAVRKCRWNRYRRQVPAARIYISSLHLTIFRKDNMFGLGCKRENPYRKENNKDALYGNGTYHDSQLDNTTSSADEQPLLKPKSQGNRQRTYLARNKTTPRMSASYSSAIMHDPRVIECS